MYIPFGFMGSSGDSSLDIDDIVSSGIVIFSLRKLSGSYSGNCIKVRRSSDNATQDIGFTSSEVGAWVDDSAINTFIGGGTGYIDTWYDQSGNGYDVSQSTLTYQPVLVSDVFSLTGGTSFSVQFDGTDDNLFHDAGSNVFSASANLTIHMAYRMTTSSFDSMFACNSSAATPNTALRYLRYSTTGRFYTNGTNNALSGDAPTTTEHALLEYDGVTNSWTPNDGTADTLASTGNGSRRYFVFGAGGSTGSQGWGGEIAEMIWTDESLSSGDNDTIRDDQNTIYTLY